MFCIYQGEVPFKTRDRVVNEDVGIRGLQQLKELVTACAPECLQRNPITTYEAMASADDIVYCPFAYGYSNYARSRYARRPLHFGGLLGGLHSTLGGTGLAVSVNCQHRQAALEYAEFVAGGDCQRTLYVQSGGQPGHLAAWRDPDSNRITNNYFSDTLPTLDEAYLRPRYNGYLHFQDKAGPVIHEFLGSRSDPHAALKRLDELYRISHETA